LVLALAQEGEDQWQGFGFVDIDESKARPAKGEASVVRQPGRLIYAERGDFPQSLQHIFR
jgi:hypothetical protein